MYSIVAHFKNGDTEEVDETESRSNARFLADEYRVAFGSDVVISIVSKKT